MADVVVKDWTAVAKSAGQHGIRYRTNAALEAFLSEVDALSQAGAGGGVVVKPLRWKRRSRSSDDFYVETDVGEYCAGLVHSSYVAIRRSIRDAQLHDEVLHRGLGLEEAKAVCQADYEARILAALAPSPSAVEDTPAIECCAWGRERATPVQPTASVEAVIEARGLAAHLRIATQRRDVPDHVRSLLERAAETLASLTPAPTQGDGGKAVMAALEAADAVLTGEDACGLDPIVGSHNPHEHAAGLVREALRVREATRPHPTDPGHWRWRGE